MHTSPSIDAITRNTLLSISSTLSSIFFISRIYRIYCIYIINVITPDNVNANNDIKKLKK